MTKTFYKGKKRKLKSKFKQDIKKLKNLRNEEKEKDHYKFWIKKESKNA